MNQQFDKIVGFSWCLVMHMYFFWTDSEYIETRRFLWLIWKWREGKTKYFSSLHSLLVQKNLQIHLWIVTWKTGGKMFQFVTIIISDRPNIPPRNVPRNVPLFWVSSVFPYSMGEQGKVKRNLYFWHFFPFFWFFFFNFTHFLVILYLPKPKI